MASTADQNRERAEAEERYEHLPVGCHEATGFDESGFLTPSIVPDICATVDLLNNWHEPGEITHQGDPWHAYAELLSTALRYLAESRTLEQAGLRAFTVVKMLRPSLLPHIKSPKLCDVQRGFDKPAKRNRRTRKELQNERIK